MTDLLKITWSIYQSRRREIRNILLEICWVRWGLRIRISTGGEITSTMQAKAFLSLTKNFLRTIDMCYNIKYKTFFYRVHKATQSNHYCDYCYQLFYHQFIILILKDRMIIQIIKFATNCTCCMFYSSWGKSKHALFYSVLRKRVITHLFEGYSQLSIFMSSKETCEVNTGDKSKVNYLI